MNAKAASADTDDFPFLNRVETLLGCPLVAGTVGPSRGASAWSHSWR
jgi:hypothetical protein